MHSENETQTREIPPPLLRVMLADDALEKARREARTVESETMKATLRNYFFQLQQVCKEAGEEIR